jgi:hypothetical protein
VSLASPWLPTVLSPTNPYHLDNGLATANSLHFSATMFDTAVLQPPMNRAMPTMLSRLGPVTGPMPDGQPYIIKTLLSAANHKQETGVGYRSVRLMLTLCDRGHVGRNLCPYRNHTFSRHGWPLGPLESTQAVAFRPQSPCQTTACRFAKAPLS